MIQKFICAVTCWLTLHTISLPAVADSIDSQIDDIRQLEVQFEELRQFEEDPTCNNALTAATNNVYEPARIEHGIKECRNTQRRTCGDKIPTLQGWDAPGWNFHEIQTTIADCNIEGFRDQLKRRRQQYQQDLCYKNHKVLSQLENIDQLASRLGFKEKEHFTKQLEPQQVTEAQEFLRKSGLVSLEGESTRALQFTYEALLIERKIQQDSNKFWITHTYGRSSHASFQWWSERQTLPDCPPNKP
jgi:hypothetical protein